MRKFTVCSGLGGKRISVSRVHALLTRELAALHATAPQRNLVATEIQKVHQIDIINDYLTGYCKMLSNAIDPFFYCSRC